MVAAGKNVKNHEKKMHHKSNLATSIKVIIFIIIISLIPVLFYNPDISFGPLDVFRQDFFKTEIRLSKYTYNTKGLMNAIQNDDLKIIKLFVRSGFNINNISDAGISPLCLAAEKGNLDAVNLLIQADANLIIRNYSDGLTPIYCAIKGNNIQIIEKLAASGVGLNFRTELNEGISPLHYAAALGLDNIVAFLVNAGSKVNMTDVNGQTPLHKAVSQDNIVVLYVLLNAGADVDIADKFDNTAIDLAKSQNKDLYVSLLKRYSKY